jgi:hypothetical protein
LNHYGPVRRHYNRHGAELAFKNHSIINLNKLTAEARFALTSQRCAHASRLFKKTVSSY